MNRSQRKFKAAIEDKARETRMPPWRNEALVRLPELKQVIEETTNPYGLWIELNIAFQSAYESQPANESLIRRIYGYAFWCNAQARGATAEDDLLTCVSVCFYEHIPQHWPSREDMTRWFSPEELEGAKDLFSYQIGEEEFQKLREEFVKNGHRYDAGLRKAVTGSS